MIVISYDSGYTWGVTSEWVGDKLRVLSAKNVPVTLLTGPRSLLADTKNLKVLRSYSLSWLDFRDEIRLSGMRLSLTINYVFAGTLGRLFDFIFELLAGSRSYGKWSWVFSTFGVGVRESLKQKSPVVFTTGGPSAAHFVGLLLKLSLPKIQLYVELQDPFIGSEMHVSPKARKVLMWLEAMLIKYATKVVFVTKAAASRATERHSKSLPCNNVVAIYPGAWNFSISRIQKPLANDSALTFLHLGTLYSNRNLDLLFSALDSVRIKEVTPPVEILNLGQLAVEDPSAYLQRKDFRDLGSLGRVDALKFAASVDYLLLVQHKDSRSEETIPYKTYDYLNLGVPIVALTKNEELNKLVIDHGGFCADVGNQTEIEGALLAAFKYRSSPEYSSYRGEAFSIFNQVDLLFELEI